MLLNLVTKKTIQFKHNLSYTRLNQFTQYSQFSNPNKYFSQSPINSTNLHLQYYSQKRKYPSHSFITPIHKSLSYKSFSTTSQSANSSTKLTNEEEFIKISSHFLEDLFEKIEALEIDRLETDFVEGVLKVNFLKSRQNYIINIQRPNLQIWFSSPISGPQRYEYNIIKKTWNNIRNDIDMLSLLQEEFNSILKAGYGLDRKIRI